MNFHTLFQRKPRLTLGASNLLAMKSLLMQGQRLGPALVGLLLLLLSNTHGLELDMQMQHKCLYEGELKRSAAGGPRPCPAAL